MMAKNKLVGITGGIGAGKSALARVYSQAGYPVVSADELAREVVAPGSDGLKEVVALFGSGSLGPDGALDRGYVRAEIARDSHLRTKLEAITHPRIQRLSQERAQAHFRAGASLVFYEAPLLFEAKSEHGMDAVICVYAPDALRIARVVQRDGRSAAEVELLLRSQMPQEEKMKRSQYLVLNDGQESALEARALAVLQKIEES